MPRLWSKHLPSIGSLLLVLTPSLFLPGCADNTANAPYRTYLKRLSNTLSVALPEHYLTATPRPPRSGRIQLEIPSDKLDTLDFLSLSGCALQVTIGKRNSSLGRMARPSQRLLLELEYLRLAPACVEHLRDNNKAELGDRLNTAWRAKQGQLPARIFNATLGGEEYRAFWLPAPEASVYPPVGTATTATALGAINQQVRRWLAGDYNADNHQFEILLSEVAGGNGGVLLKSLIRQRDWLATADQMVQQRIDRGPLCAPRTRHPAADILPNVIRLYFVDGIQPQAARMNSSYFHLHPPVSHLESLLETVLPVEYRNWMGERETLFDDANIAPRRHVEQLKRILAPCDNPAG